MNKVKGGGKRLNGHAQDRTDTPTLQSPRERDCLSEGLNSPPVLSADSRGPMTFGATVCLAGVLRVFVLRTVLACAFYLSNVSPQSVARRAPSEAQAGKLSKFRGGPCYPRTHHRAVFDRRVILSC